MGHVAIALFIFSGLDFIRQRTTLPHWGAGSTRWQRRKLKRNACVSAAIQPWPEACACCSITCTRQARGVHVACMWLARGLHVACTWLARGVRVRGAVGAGGGAPSRCAREVEPPQLDRTLP